MNKTYRNTTDEILPSRNPRFELKPGDTIFLTPGMVSHSVRMWIRTGALSVVEDASAGTKKTSPKKPVAKKTAKSKPVAKA